MGIDVFHEELLGLAQAAKRLPKAPSGKKISTSTIYRWANRGLVGKSGERIRLETIMFGGQMCTTAEALQRYFNRLSDDRPIVVPEPQLSKRRQREIEAAERFCREQGL